MADKLLKSITFPDLTDKYIIGDSSLSETGAAADAKATGDALATKANIDGSYEDLTAGTANQINTSVRANDKTPYIFRTSGGSVDIGDREYINSITGGTVAWNQLSGNGAETRTVNGVTFTVNSDGSITVNGTASADASYNVGVKATGRANHVRMFTGAPTNGSMATYYIKDGYGNVTDNARGAFIEKHNVGDCIYQIRIKSGVTMNNVKYIPQIFDLTQMFGSTIADYIYSLETANAGAGVAWFKKLFNKPYYAYNAGELKSVSGLVSHDMTGFNQWDEEWEVGSIDNNTGQPTASTTTIRVKNFIPCLPNTAYYGKVPETYILFQYDANKAFISATVKALNTSFTTDANARFIKFRLASDYGTTYKNDICINLAWDNSRNGEYEPYVKHSYPLDSDLTLRGIPKLDANNNLYYDGDTYEADGTVTRKYGVVEITDSNISSTTSTYTNIVYARVTKPVDSYDRGKATARFMCKYPVNEATTDWDNANKIGYSFGGASYSEWWIGFPVGTTLEQMKTALVGGKITYELATPTTETADPYTNPQIVDDFGTEEYVISDSVFAVPVGHDTDYPINMVAKLEMAPNSPEGNGDYIVRQTNGMNSYVPLVIEDALPTMPSTAGTYKLTVTVTEGSDPVLSWTAE